VTLSPAVQWLEHRANDVLSARDELRALNVQHRDRIEADYGAYNAWLHSPEGQAYRDRVKQLSAVVRGTFHVHSHVRRRIFELIDDEPGGSARWPVPHAHEDIGDED